MIMGYYLSLAGVEVTFLVRPHRTEALSRPQVLYCYDDNKLKEYKDFKYITDPQKMVGADYDYIIVTLDGTALRNEVGQNLVKSIGDAVRATKTQVILGSVFVELKPWFLEVSGLNEGQVTNSVLFIMVYETRNLTLPVYPPTDPQLVAKADLAYSDALDTGFMVDDSASPNVANDFAGMWKASGVSSCAVIPAAQFGINIAPFFPIFAACKLMGWPKFKDIRSEDETWSLGVAAAKEIQGLGIFGEPGRQAAEATTEAGMAATWAAMEKAVLPFDMQTFNRYHHGGKVNVQDQELLRACLSYGEAEGKSMSALQELLQRDEQHQT